MEMVCLVLGFTLGFVVAYFTMKKFHANLQAVVQALDQKYSTLVDLIAGWQRKI